MWWCGGAVVGRNRGETLLHSRPRHRHNHECYFACLGLPDSASNPLTGYIDIVDSILLGGLLINKDYSL